MSAAGIAISRASAWIVRRRRAVGWVLGLASFAWVMWTLGTRLDPSPQFTWAGREFRLTEPRVFWVLGALPLLLFAAGRSLAAAPRWLRLLSLVLRVCFVLAVALGAGQLVETEKSSRLCSVVLLDVSESMGDGAIERGRAEALALWEGKKGGDELTLVVFAKDARVVVPVQLEARWSLPEASELRKSVEGGATDVERALRTSTAFVGHDCLPRVLVLSDGRETRGQAEAAAGLLGPTGRLNARLVTEPRPAELAIVGLAAPETIRVGEPFDVRVELSATAAAGVASSAAVSSAADVRLYQGDLLVATRTLEDVTAQTSLTFPSVVRAPGPVHYRAVLEPRAADHFSANNQASIRLDVPGPPRVLLVDSEPAQASYLARALSAQQFDVELRSPAGFPASAAELSEFSFVVLSDVKRSALLRRSEQLLVDYVRAGGGLLYSGGAAGYGPGGWQGSELAKILPVSMDDEKTRETPGVALALVIDRSGSMTGLPLEMAKEACSATLGVLEGQDLLEVIAFDSKPTRYVTMQPARYRSRIAAEIQRIQPGGGTELFASLDLAFQDLAGTDARRKHIILLTDGNAQSEGLFELVSSAFADGITVTAVGLGKGVNEELLRSIAESGGGRFHLAAEPSSLPRIFTRETEMVSERTAVEDWFAVRAAATPEFFKGLGLTQAPYVRGFTRVQLGPAPAEALLVSEQGDPILARGRAGLGFALAWTSDLKARWGTDWLKWPKFGQFLGQMLRAHQRTSDDQILPMTVTLLGDEVVARVEAFDKQQRFDSGLESTLTLQGESASGEKVELLAPFRLVGPGLYEARQQLPDFGSYSLLAVHTRRGGQSAGVSRLLSRGQVAYPYPEELRVLEADEALLARLTAVGRGVLNPSLAQLQSAQGDHVLVEHPRKSVFIGLALALFLLDLVARRWRVPAWLSRTRPESR